MLTTNPNYRVQKANHRGKSCRPLEHGKEFRDPRLTCVRNETLIQSTPDITMLLILILSLERYFPNVQKIYAMELVIQNLDIPTDGN